MADYQPQAALWAVRRWTVVQREHQGFPDRYQACRAPHWSMREKRIYKEAKMKQDISPSLLIARVLMLL